MMKLLQSFQILLSINRNIVECKSDLLFSMPLANPVLIETLWNVNLALVSPLERFLQY